MDISRRRFLLTTTLFSVGTSGAIVSACGGGGGGTTNVSNTPPLTLADYKSQMRLIGTSLKMGRTEVTWQMWREYCLATNKNGPVEPKQYFISETQPVVNVTWDECKVYADWAGLRLPTSAEWLLAATNGDDRNFPWGGYGGLKNNSYPGWDNNKVVRYVNQGRPFTMPVGSKPSGNSPFGCSDMAGNVAEWTATDVDGQKELRGGASADVDITFLLCKTVVLLDPTWSNEWIGFRLCADA